MAPILASRARFASVLAVRQPAAPGTVFSWRNRSSPPHASLPATPAPTHAPAPPASPPFAGSWPDYRSGPAQTDWNSAENQLDAAAARRLAPRWQASGAGEAPVIAGGNLYLANQAEVDVLPAAGCGQSSCDLAWRANLGMSGVPAGAPAVADGGLFVTVNVNQVAWLYAFHAGGCGASTCSPWWTRQLDTNTMSGGSSNGYASSGPVAAGGLVFTGPANPGKLYAFATGGCGASTCAPIWTATLQAGLGFSSPAAANGVLYVADGDLLTAYNAPGCGAPTCSPLWATHVGSGVGSPPAVANGRVFVDDAGGTVHAYDAKSGTALWSTSTGGGNGEHAAPLAAPNVVVAPGSNSLQVLDPASGALQWTVPVGTAVTSASLTGGDGVGYVLSNDDRLFAFATTPCGASSCAPIWSARAGPDNSSGSLGGYDGPVVAGGRLFLHTPDGLLTCYEPS